MDDHGKKKIAPVVITAIFLIYYIAYFCFVLMIVPGIAKLLLGFLPLLLGGTLIAVCKQRLHEINGGEEDDLSKY